MYFRLPISEFVCLVLSISALVSLLLVCCVDSANNFAMQHKRKTISGQDVLDAMKEMEFERFVEPLKRSLEGTCCAV